MGYTGGQSGCGYESKEVKMSQEFDATDTYPPALARCDECKEAVEVYTMHLSRDDKLLCNVCALEYAIDPRTPLGKADVVGDRGLSASQ